MEKTFIIAFVNKVAGYPVVFKVEAKEMEQAMGRANEKLDSLYPSCREDNRTVKTIVDLENL